MIKTLKALFKNLFYEDPKADPINYTYHTSLEAARYQAAESNQLVEEGCWPSFNDYYTRYYEDANQPRVIYRYRVFSDHNKH